MRDVMIAGGGPVGLFLATELALGGCSVLVLERDEEVTSQWKALPRGLRGLSAGSAEVLHRRGLLYAVTNASGADAAKVGAAPDAIEAPNPRDVSHFAGMGLDGAAIDVSALPYRLPSPAMEGFMTSLEAVSSVMTERATALGVDVLRGAPVTAVAHDDESVTVTAGGQDHRARYLVGCDGGRSTVRGLAGFDFVGTYPLVTGYVAKVTFADAGQTSSGRRSRRTRVLERTSPFEIRTMDDPKFHGMINDPGYLTTNLGMRQLFYYTPNADPAVIEADERRKDMSTAADSEGENLPPAQSPSRSIKVPTLLVVGDKDQYCTTGACTPKSMLANELTYYSHQADLEAIVVRDSGHDVQLHRNATQTNAAIPQWVKDAVT